jgi:diguanylate cyclase (GGDEF)-like protein
VPQQILGHHLEIGVSIGVALAPEHGASAKELMANVDQALYRAKSMGRGCFFLFEGARGLQKRRI